MWTRRLCGFFCLTCVLSAIPVNAAPPEADVRSLIKKYVDAFNTADAAVLVDEVFLVPAADRQGVVLAWDHRFDALRREDFGRLDLYESRICSLNGGQVFVEMRYSFQYTFGGVMPPGDQALRLDMVQAPDGLRIVGERAVPFDEQRSCQ